ncbi:MAG: DUF1792 domain-containing protein [Lachnospiraceae bacterium]|nr:DUF1792 domain-containing protein [Lachnospiraceae bacterium]
MPQISVIVPVYKVEPYLRHCVDSILRQSFTDFELILVDDGSPDGCPAICDEYAAKDSRVVVIHQQNGGLSAARNVGIDWVFVNSDSQWISFIDSDDWIHPQMLEALYHAVITHDVTVSICGYGETEGEDIQIDENCLSAKVQKPEWFYVEHTVNATIACAKLYGRECFTQIRYPNGKLHEDEFTTYKILFDQEKLAVISEPLYCYYHNPNSITTSAWTPRRMEVIEAFDEQLSFFEEHDYPKALARRVQSYLWMLGSQYYSACVVKQDYVNEIKQLRRKMKSILRRYALQIDRTWPEYEAILEIVYPVRSRICNMIFGTYGENMKKKIIACWERIYCSNIMLSAIYHKKNKHHCLNIMSPEETIEYILQHECSISRFGDGEFELILQPDRDLGFQNRSKVLAAKLEDVLGNKNPNLLVCIPLALNTILGRTKHSRMFWYSWGERNNQHHHIVELIRKHGNGNYSFGDSQITRFYIAFQKVKIAKRIFTQIRKLWDARDLIVVEGEETRLGIGNDLFDNAASIKRILCPATNAFDRYGKIVETVCEVWNGELLLLALGPTATVLAADFAGMGMQALDIGHVDIEYEWFLRGAKEHEQIPGKFTNEVCGGNQVVDCDDEEYNNQIIARVL